jgi:sterol 3beta-glucosyltransferase
VSVVLVHGAVPSAFQPPSGLPDLGAFGNRLAWRIGRWALNRGLKRFPDRLRASLGMAPARDLIDTVWASGDLTLLAISPEICATQPDWPDHYKVCGALDTPASVAEDAVSPQLEAFLAAGSPPVYLTFGSMTSGSDERQTIALLAEAARAAAVRAIIQVPSWAQLGVECSDQVRFVASAPHAAVFPRCSAVVHHGGAGTSHAALRAGVPSVVVPHTAEQELWARELRRLGVAGPPIIRRRATPQRIADAIVALGKSGQIGANARALGARMAQEDGVATAVRLIEARFAV